MKTTFLLLLFVFIFQSAFSQENTWTAIDKNYSVRTLTTVKALENIKDTEPVTVEVFSFRNLIDDIDSEKEKAVSKNVLPFEDIHEKIDRKGKVNFKKGAVYLVRLQEGVHGGRFRIQVNTNADKKLIDNFSKYLSENITQGSILKETTDTPKSKNVLKSFIITISNHDHFDINTLKDKFKNIIEGITKVATNRSTTFYKITT